MPYLLLLIGGILAVAALYRFILRADAHQVKALFLAVAAAGVGIAAFFFALTGKLPAAMAILVALWPIAVSYLKNRPAAVRAPDRMPLDEKEAYDVLGLPHGAGPEDVREAHLRLMKKVHPDQKGSDWLAKKINAAKDLLLDKEPKA
jgi:hypothetical protein